MHLVGLIKRLYHDARSPVRQIYAQYLNKNICGHQAGVRSLQEVE